jgi:trimeric autotransporter adhesin
VWSQQAYVKASNPGPGDLFGSALVLDGDGDTLVVGSWDEDGNGVGPFAQLDDSVAGAGAAYVFTRSAMGTWSQQAYLKASNPGAGDYFGYDVALSDSGDTLAVSAVNEDSSASGVGGNQADDSASNSGALYVFERSMMGAWSQQAYIKATNPGVNDRMGRSIALSGDGNVLAGGVDAEDGGTTGIGGNQADESASAAGAVQVFVRDPFGTWSPRAYVKAPNTGAGDMFGSGVALSGDGNTLAVGAYGEDGSATGIGGDQSNDSMSYAGAVYLY